MASGNFKLLKKDMNPKNPEKPIIKPMIVFTAQGCSKIPITHR
jgi:hypothetical protein